MLFFISIFILEEILESGVDTDAGHFTEVLQRDCSKYSSTCTFLTSSMSCMYERMQWTQYTCIIGRHKNVIL